MDSLVPTIAKPLSPELAQRQRAPEDLHAAAEQFEAIFIQTLLKQARQSKLADDILIKVLDLIRSNPALYKMDPSGKLSMNIEDAKNSNQRRIYVRNFINEIS